MMFLKQVLTAATVLLGYLAFAEDDPYVCHWTGDVSSDWWDYRNWKEEKVPGLWLTTGGKTNGCRGCTAVFAYSTNRLVRPNPDTKSVSSLRLLSIGNIVITGADAPEYVFADSLESESDTSFLPLEGGGSITVESDVERSPYVSSVIVPGVHESEAQTFTIRNDAKVSLRLRHLSANIGVEQYSRASGGDWFCSTMRYEGSGDIEVSFTVLENSNWALATELAMDGGRLLVKSAMQSVYRLQVPSDLSLQELEFVDGASLTLDCRDAAIGEIAGDLLVTGEGSLIWSATDVGSSQMNPLNVNSGATLTFDTGVTLKHSSEDDDKVLDGATGGGAYFSSTTTEDPGMVRMNGKTDFPGVLRLGGGVTYVCSSVGNSGSIAQTGRGSELRLGGGACFKYAGAGETTDKSIYLVDSAATLENAGDGLLMFAALSGSSAANVLTVSGGKVGFAGAATSAVTLKSGVELVANGASVSYSSIVLSGAASLSVDEGASVTVASVSRASGSLDVTGSGAVKFSSLSAGASPGWLTVGGTAALIGSDHSLTSRSAAAADYKIDVHDDVIPNAAGKIVEISKTENETTGPITLAANSTEVGTLRQQQAVDDAEVNITSAQQLSAGVISVGEGAKSLTLGSEVSVGKVGPVGGLLELEVLDSSSSLTVNSAINIGSSKLVKTGVGKVKVESPFSGIVSHWAGALTFMNLNGAGALTLQGGEGAVEFSGKSAPYALKTVADSEQSPTGNGLVISTSGSLPFSNLQVGDGAVVTMDGAKIYQNGVSVVTTNVQPSIPKFAYVGSNSVGVLAFESGSFTGKIVQAGVAATSKSAIFVRGGEVVNLCSSLPNGGDWLMDYGYNYLEVSGGKYTVAGDWMAGRNGQVNVVVGPEGTFSHSSVRQSRIRFGGYSCDGAIYVNGGTFDYSPANDFAYIPLNGSTAFRTQLTVDAGGFADFGSRYVNFSHMDGSDARRTESVINLNDGGTMRAAYVIRSSARVHTSDGGTATADNYTNKLAFIQFNGGVWKNGSTSEPFGLKTKGVWNVAPTAIYTFKKGATMEIANGNTVPLPPGGSFQAPYGQGIESVKMTPAFSAMRFVGAPSVRICGDGFGGTAVAVFDAESQSVSSIRVTGRGVGYTTAEAEIYYGYASSAETKVATLPVTLSENVSGGLTKTGAGTLILKGTNTYTGATVVKAGTLKLNDKGVLSQDSGISLAGGTFDLNGAAIILSDFGGTGEGSIVNGTVSLKGLIIDMDEVKAGEVDVLDFSNPISFSSSATIKLLNATEETMDRSERYTILKFQNQLPETMPELDPTVYENLASGWRILVADDKAILRYTSGSLYIVY